MKFNEIGPFDDEKILSVDRRAKLEQLAEECCELGKACMKLIRAEGNGNPCSASFEEAADKVVEEWSDVLVAGEYLMEMLQPDCRYDISARVEEIAEGKIKRWQERVKEADEKTGN